LPHKQHYMWSVGEEKGYMRVRLVSLTKFRLTVILMAAFALVVQPLYSVLSAQVANATTVTAVSGNTSEWLFNRDVSTSTPYSFTTQRAKTGYGSIYVAPIGTNPSDKFIAENFVKTPISSLNSISYDFRIAGNGTAASAKQFYLNVYATIDASDEYYDCRFDYAPTIGSTGSFKKASFSVTDAPTHVAKRGARIAACPATLAEMPAGSHMRAFAVNVGDTSASDIGLAGYLDNVVVDKTSGVSTYDFERELPQANYVLPTSTKNLFRPGDNPVRLKIDDSEQVERVRFSLWSYDKVAGSFGSHIKNLTINREKCDLRQAGNYIICDIKNANGWIPLAEGTYAVKLTTFIDGEAVIRTKMSEYWSSDFTVDVTTPTIDSFALESPASGYANTNVTVAATASDANTVESVNFYITTPREDGACTGNGTKLAANRVWTTEGDGKYRTALDTSALSDGQYCITAVARDQAQHNSSLSHLKVVVDRTAPTLVVSTPEENSVFGGNDQIIVTSYMEDANGLDNYFIDINSANVSILSDPDDVEELPEAETTEATSTESAGLTIIAVYNAADFADGEYVITVRVTDKAGNATTETRTIFIDHSMPTTPGQGVVTPPTVEQTDQANDELAQLTQRLTQPFAVSSVFGATTPQVAQAEKEVLGANKVSDVASGAQTVAAMPTEEGWKIFGTAWYWWVLLAAILGVSTAWLLRRAKQRSAQDL
jgi:hypothetical protein